jgi:DNA mismatch repair protein MutL
MPQIFVLPEHIASQIAAGEVVERPASVVKELVENSIDAGATKIVVDVSEACRHIRVADNGCGMEVADASLAFQRHATSKLSSANDLWNLNTLGFRGEALPSIASVSRLICSTRTDKSEIGTQVTSIDGAMTVTETGCAIGTIIDVEDLFYNVPARLSFLKKPGTEFAHIADIVQGLAITYPNIAFELSLDGISKLKTLGVNELDGAINESNFFNGQEDFIVLDGKDGVLGLEISGRLVSPKSFRGDRKGIMTIVNNRPVRCSLAYKALDYAYADLIPRGRYPLGVLHLKVNPGDLDINIHPTKKEIRYARGNDVYLFLQRQIMNALRNANTTKTHAVEPHRNIERPNDFDRSSFKDNLDFKPLPESGLARSMHKSSSSSSDMPLFNNNMVPGDGMQLYLKESAENVFANAMDAETNAIFGETRNPLLKELESPFEVISEFATRNRVELETHKSSKQISLPLDWRLVGYFGNTYILLETSAGLAIVEQHIAHERTLYEKLLSCSSQAEGQTLLISLPLQLSEEQKSVLEENIDELLEQGFEFEMDGTDISCSQVPVELAHKDYASVIQSMLQELAESSRVNPKLDIVKSIACQSAIKNGMPLATDQIIELLNEWHKTPRNETCPHGRPIQLSFSYEKLFQMFHPA